MKCRNIQKELIFYLDRELPEERMKSIARHLEECQECCGYLDELKKDLEIIDAERNPEVSPYFFTRLSARLDEQPEAQNRNVWARVVQPAFFSLLLIAAVYGGFRLGYQASAPVVQHPDAKVLPFVDDFADEPIESFLLDQL